MGNIVNHIIQNRIPCFFISPHLDDAVLSAGGLLSHLAGKTPVTLINIFTNPGDKPYTMAAKGYLRDCGFTDAGSLYAKRYEEDAAVCALLGIQSINLGFIDGSFRRRTKTSRIVKYIAKKIPEVEHSYPLGRKILRIAKDDRTMAIQIAKKLKELVAGENQFVVFCPLGTVKHMDHVLTRDLCIATFKNIIFWNDYPYILTSHKTRRQLKKRPLTQFVWNDNLAMKKKLIATYTSQLPSLFHGKEISADREVYYQFTTPQIEIQAHKLKKFFMISPRGYLNRSLMHQ